MAIDFTALNNACVLYYSMDNADVSGSTILDLTSNNNDATITGANTGVAGIFNEGISFTSSDFIERAELTSLYNADFSISMWVKYTDSSYFIFTSQQDDGSNGYDGFAILTDGVGNGQIRTRIFGDSNNDGIETTSSYNDGNWHHLVMTWDENNNNMELYIDNSLVGTKSFNPGNFQTNTVLRINGRQGSELKGDFECDEYILFSKPLNSSEVDYLYNSGAPTVNQQYPFSPNAVYEIKGQVTLSGVATQGATLRLYDQTGGTYEGSTTTDTSGNYLFDNLIDGNEYHVSVEYDDGTTKYNDESKPYVTPTEQ